MHKRLRTAACTFAPAQQRGRWLQLTQLAQAARGWGWLAGVCAAALLLAFASAVKLVVAQGHERRAQSLQTANSLWRCNTLPGQKARTECRIATR